jgi:hypothetical protein
MAKFSEVGSAYTANLPIRVTGTVISADTSVAYSPSLTTNARLQKIVDSLNAAGWAIPTFQQVLTAGSTLTTNNNIILGGNNLQITSSGEEKLSLSPATDTYLFGDGGGSAAIVNISPTYYLTNFSGVNFSKFTYSGREWLIGDVDNNWDGIKIKMDNSGVASFGAITFNDSTHILIDDNSHFFKFNTRQSERVRLNESGILIPNGIMLTSGNGGDSVVHRNSATGQFYIKPVTGGYTTLSQFVDETAWRSFYSNGSGDVTALAFGDAAKVLTSNGASAAPTWETVTGSGTVNTGAANKAAYYPSAGTTVDDVTGVEFNGSNVLQKNTAQTASDTILKIVPATSQTGDYLNIRDGVNQDVFSLNSNGYVRTTPKFESWYSMWDEFTVDISQGFQKVTSGAGSSFTLSGGTDHDGWGSWFGASTGTTSTGLCAYTVGNGGGSSKFSIVPADVFNCGTKINLTTLSDGTESYIFFFGFNDNSGSLGSISDGIYIRYNHGDSSGKFILCTEKATTLTEKASLVTVAANTDYTLEISVYNNVAYYWINKVYQGSISTNIPDGIANSMLLTGLFLKTVGTTARLMEVDWAAYGSRKL